MKYPITHADSMAYLQVAVELLLTLLAAYVALSLLYCLSLLFSAWLEARHRSGSAVAGRSPTTRFCILIPAHDESLVISSTLEAVLALEYPSDKIRCVVVADNCTDDTAALSRRARGVEVLERTNLQDRGKGYALNWALSQLLSVSANDALSIDSVVIIDADTIVDPLFLRAMDSAIASSADPSDRFAAQGYYQVHNSSDNWRTALMAGALSLVHYVRPMARERWGASVGLKGNGMCFSSSIARDIAWRGESITEDLDYGLDLIERSGIRVRFIPDALVKAQMPTDRASAEGQRRRWEGGRGEIVRRRALPLLWEGVFRADKLRMDAAFDLICPPLAQLCVSLAAYLGLVAVLYALHASSALLWLVSWVAAVLGLAVYVLAGFKVGKAPAAAYRALAMAGFYVPWKIAAVITSKAKNIGWNRTKRIEVVSAQPASGPADSMEALGKR